MEKLLDLTISSAGRIVISCLGIYILVIAFTRIFGKRSFSKMSSFDFAMTVAVGSLIATTVLSSTVSLAEGALGLLAIYFFQLTAAFFRRYKNFRDAIDNTPLLLMQQDQILQENLRKARVTEGDLRAKLREANVTDYSAIQAVVFETTGDITVLHSKDMNENLKSWLLTDVAV
ncbi:membrane protein [Aequorivita aquimaris]|uniref:Membrane protein n=1 Tax=Aequorivita aquimaris TaxID=1548749 RepID=A0A137RM54_9FLAO|nr:YetF domain-containing protein [Aequorivita aquimaris]KXO01241.1 membrane protein [Aequorivita aquimaris]